MLASLPLPAPAPAPSSAPPAPAPAPAPIRDTAAQDRPREHGRAFRWRRWLAVAVAFALLAAGASVVRDWLGGAPSIAGARLRLGQVTRGTLIRDAAVTGRVVAAVSPTLYAPMPGTVTLAVRAGDTVARGAVLATIDSPELENQLARERATLAELEAAVGGAGIAADRLRLGARREADEAAIALTAATRELDSAERARAAGIATELEYQRAVDALDTARIRDRNARASAGLAGRTAGFDVATARTRHERQRLTVVELERRVGELTVRAPVDGVVGTVAVADRAVVAAGAPLATVVDLGQLEVELAVPEVYADDLGLGMTVEVAVGAATTAGAISAVSPEVVDHQVSARVRFTGAQPPGLRQRQAVSARVLIDERPDVVMVPRGPFVETHGGRFVYVVDGGVAVRRAIQLGATSVGAVEVLEGLSPGERVVIAGSETFDDEPRVQIND